MKKVRAEESIYKTLSNVRKSLMNNKNKYWL